MKARRVDEPCLDRVAEASHGAAEDVEPWPKVADTTGRECAHGLANLCRRLSGHGRAVRHSRKLGAHVPTTRSLLVTRKKSGGGSRPEQAGGEKARPLGRLAMIVSQ